MYNYIAKLVWAERLIKMAMAMKLKQNRVQADHETEKVQVVIGWSTQLIESELNL